MQLIVFYDDMCYNCLVDLIRNQYMSFVQNKTKIKYMMAYALCLICALYLIINVRKSDRNSLALANHKAHLEIHGKVRLLNRHNYHGILRNSCRKIQENRYRFTVNAGDTISCILKKAGVSQRDIYTISNVVARCFNLYRLQIGKTIYLSAIRHGDESVVETLKINVGGNYQIQVCRNSDGTYSANRVQIQKYEIFESVDCKFCKDNIEEVLIQNGLDQVCIDTVKKVLKLFKINNEQDVECKIFYKYNVSDDNEVVGDVVVMKCDICHSKTDEQDGEKIVTTVYNMHDGYDYVFVDSNGVIQRDMNDLVLSMPLKRCLITSSFGYRIHPVTKKRLYHRGVDFYANIGTDVFASGSGIVVQAGYGGAYGNYVKIKHRNGMYTVYAHLSKIFVNVGQRVNKGCKIALSGNTGRTTGPHLHYEVIINNQFVDPVKNIKMYCGPESIPVSRIIEYNLMIDEKLMYCSKIKRYIESKNKNIINIIN